MASSTLIPYSGLTLFKELQDSVTSGNYVQKEPNKSLMSSEDKDRLDYLFHQTSKQYAAGDVIKVPEFPAYYCLECVTAGTTDTVAPDFESIYSGSSS